MFGQAGQSSSAAVEDNHRSDRQLSVYIIVITAYLVSLLAIVSPAGLRH